MEPFTAGEIRIGSGRGCQLRFGDPGIPDVHTTITVTPEAVILQCHCQQPELIVNGSPVTECRLHDGDMLELLDHRLLLRLTHCEDRITLDEDSFAAGGDTVSAEQIVDRLQEQVELIESLTDYPEQQIARLLHAAVEASRPRDGASVTVPASTQTSSDHNLQLILSLLQKQHEAGRIRMESLATVLNNVVHQQKIIADTLETLSSRIQSLDNNLYPHRRASA